MPILRPLAKARFRPDALFRPRSVGLIGDAPELAANMAGFEGDFFTAATVAELPSAPDLAVCVGPPDLPALAARGTFAAICLTPAAGLAAQARAAEMRVMGPNAFGLAIPELGLNATASHVPIAAGRVALVSQSAALCRSVLDWAGPNGVGFSHVVGLGGAADMGFGLVLDWLSRDPGTGAILLDIRSIRNRRAFMSAARAAARLRPVVALHAGGRLSDPSGRADQVFDAMLRRAGIVRVTRLADLFGAAETLTRARPLRHDSVAIVTNAIGPGQLAADAAAVQGVPLAQLTPATQAVLAMALPPGPPGLGLVWTGHDWPIRVAEAAALLSGATEVGGIVAVIAPTGPADAAAMQALAAAMAGLKMPLLAAVLGETTAAGHRATLVAAGVPVFATPEQAMRAYGQLVEQRRARAAARELPPRAVLSLAPDRVAVQRIFAAVRQAGRHGLLQDEALDVLSAYGLPVVPGRAARTADDAAAAGSLLGFPAVLKLARSARPRASGPGAVALDLPDEAAIRHAAGQLEARRARLRQDGLAEGFLVQRQVGRARELRVLSADDALFGPYLAFGQGGSAAELRGLAIDLPPLNLPLAANLIARSPAARLLAETHDQPAANLDAVADALVRLSQLLVDFPEIGELDLNPLFADADGVSAGDAWIGLRPAGEAGVLTIAPYPAELDEAWVSGGETLHIRPIRPEDAEAHAALFARLTPEDIRYRFFSMIRALGAEQIARMTQVDYEREMALVATRGPDTVGVARLVREPYAPRGEFAIVVEPSMKGRGLGRKLMERLIAWGAAQGMVEIEGQVLAENAPMLAFMRRMGFSLHRSTEDPEVVDAILPLA